MTKTLILFWVASLLGAVAFGAGDAQTGQTTTVSPPCQSSTDANSRTPTRVARLTVAPWWLPLSNNKFLEAKLALILGCDQRSVRPMIATMSFPKAPDFNLQDQDGRQVSLSVCLKTGPLLLVFYPGDFTPSVRSNFAVIAIRSLISKSSACASWASVITRLKSMRSFAKKITFPSTFFPTRTSASTKLMGQARRFSSG